MVEYKDVLRISELKQGILRWRLIFDFGSSISILNK